MANLQQKTQDTRDDIFNKYLSTKSPALDVTGTVDSDIFDVEGRTIRIPESAYKHYRKRSIRMPEKYVPIELRRRGNVRGLEYSNNARGRRRRRI